MCESYDVCFIHNATFKLGNACPGCEQEKVRKFKAFELWKARHLDQAREDFREEEGL